VEFAGIEDKGLFFRELAEEVRQAAQEAFFDDRNLWTISRTAAYLGYSPRYFKRSIATLKGFPRRLCCRLRRAAAMSGMSRRRLRSGRGGSGSEPV